MKIMNQKFVKYYDLMVKKQKRELEKKEEKQNNDKVLKKVRKEYMDGIISKVIRSIFEWDIEADEEKP